MHNSCWMMLRFIFSILFLFFCFLSFLLYIYLYVFSLFLPLDQDSFDKERYSPTFGIDLRYLCFSVVWCWSILCSWILYLVSLLSNLPLYSSISILCTVCWHYVKYWVNCCHSSILFSSVILFITKCINK